MSGINSAFTRSLLSLIMKDVRKVTTAEQRKEAWTYHFQRDHWEFHGPNGFYWNGSAGDGWDARYHGWTAYLQKHHPEMEAAGGESMAPTYAEFYSGEWQHPTASAHG